MLERGRQIARRALPSRQYQALGELLNGAVAVRKIGWRDYLRLRSIGRQASSAGAVSEFSFANLLHPFHVRHGTPDATEVIHTVVRECYGRYLPAPLARLHPRYGTPWIALLVQAVITSVILLGSLSGSTIHEAYVVLLDMTAIMSLLPLLYIFASLPVLRRRAAGRDEGIALVPGGRIACWVWATLGFATTAFAVATSAVPPDAGRPMLFILKVVGGCSLLIGVGMAFYINGSRRL